MNVRLNAFLPEVAIAVATVLLAAAFSTALQLPIIFPTGERAAFVGVHYLYPLIGLALWGMFAIAGQRQALGQIFLISLPCYALVMFVHFNVKLWIPHINPLLYDATYWRIDQDLRPLVDLCIWLRQTLSPLLPFEANVYMLGFICMFYISFCYHAVRTPSKFRELFLGALIMQAVGTFAYLIAPAVGPFIYEHGVNPMVTEGQRNMLEFYHASKASGPNWLKANGGYGFTAGLAAMPSLHSAGAFLFFLFAYRHGRLLLPLYAPLLLFILITAVATRWHYVIDIPFGLLLAWVSLKIAAVLATPQQAGEVQLRSGVPYPA